MPLAVDMQINALACNAGLREGSLGQAHGRNVREVDVCCAGAHWQWQGRFVSSDEGAHPERQKAPVRSGRHPDWWRVRHSWVHAQQIWRWREAYFLAYRAAQVVAAHAANLTFVPLVAGCTLAQLRALIFSPKRVDTFVAAMVSDAVKHNYDGINFDLEMGGFGKPEEEAYAAMLVQLQAALTKARGHHKPIAVVSACVGNTKNGVVSPAGV
eukprot:SAG25_NODE_2195_length_1853_cov_1.716648_3_plen_212_part_00